MPNADPTLSICAIGNALVDIIIATDDAFLHANHIAKGAMTLVDEAAAAALYDRAGVGAGMFSGGSAANTLAGVASLGGTCGFMGKVGRDRFGEAFAHDLHAQNVTFTTSPSADLATGRCLILVTPDAQRSMSTFLGAAVEFGEGDVDAALVQGAAITYLEGYLFDKPAAQAAFVKAATLAHKAGRRLALTLSDSFCVMRHRAAFLDLIKSQVDILFANEDELKALFETQDIDAALRHLRACAPLAAITRGARGAVIMAGGVVHEIAAQPATVVDTTGAGDLFAAGFLYGLTHGHALPDAGRIGAIAAAEVISHYGPRPQTGLRGLI